jgi:hypothetical protein
MPMSKPSQKAASKLLLPKTDDTVLHFLLDEGIDDDIGKFLEERGHKVTYGNKALPRSTQDQIVCTAVLSVGAILIAADHDMKRIAKDHGANGGRFKSMSLLKLSCRSPDAPNKVMEAISLIEHEWRCGEGRSGRRLWIELQPSVIRIVRQ